MTEVVSSLPIEKFLSQISGFGITPSKIYRNLSVDELVDSAVSRDEGVINSTGSLSVNTGKFTGRSPDDRFIVLDEITRDTIDWGKINHQIPGEKFHLSTHLVYIFVTYIFFSMRITLQIFVTTLDLFEI